MMEYKYCYLYEDIKRLIVTNDLSKLEQYGCGSLILNPKITINDTSLKLEGDLTQYGLYISREYDKKELEKYDSIRYHKSFNLFKYVLHLFNKDVEYMDNYVQGFVRKKETHRYLLITNNFSVEFI